MPFEPATTTLNGVVNANIVHEPGASPSNIIKANTPFHVHVRFDIWGSMVPLMAGNFNVQVFFEGYGSKPEVDVPAPAEVVPVTSVPMFAMGPHGPNERNYDRIIAVPTGLLTPGLYEMVSVITYTDVSGNPGPVAGFSDQETLIQVFPA